MYYRRLIAPLTCLLAACSGSETDTIAANSNKDSPAGANYVLVDDSLQVLKDDFNARVDKVRFVFLSGPTCGICLRGMADLNDEFLAEMQGDSRFYVYLVHVPTLGAREEHVPQAIPLLDGPNVSHYWEDTGIIGLHYQDVLDARYYVWDFWAIYGPGVVWDGTLPPVPEYWEHQLPGAGAPFTPDLQLDAERFARVAKRMIDDAGDASLASETVTQRAYYADGLIVPKVAQPRGVAIQQHIMGRGGYRNLKRISAVEMTARIESDDTSASLSIRMGRPDRIERIISYADTVASAAFDGENLISDNREIPRGLPWDIESQLLTLFEFDGPFVEWKDKGHKVRMLGMKKLGKTLAWQLELTQVQGQRWNLLVDSHSGSIIRSTALADNGEPEFIIEAGDFRRVSGFLFPHRIIYRDKNGELIARERIQMIEVALKAADPEKAKVTH